MSSNFPPAAKRVAIVADTTLRCGQIGAETPSNRTAGGDDRSGLTPSGLGDLFRDFDEIFSDYITLIADRCCQRAGDIPPMSCDRLCVGFGRYEVEVAFREGCR
jgi:hypothetical protein